MTFSRVNPNTFAHRTAAGELLVRCPNPVVEARRYATYVWAMFSTEPEVQERSDGTVRVSAPDCAPLIYAPFLRPPKPRPTA